jgi:chromosome partitioning protein
VKHYSKPFAAILTFCPPAGRELENTIGVVRRLGAKISPIRIGNRIAYSHAQQIGLAAQEINPDGKAAQEIAELYAYVYALIQA